LAFSRDGKSLASATWYGNLHLWDTGTGKEIRSFAGHQSGEYSAIRGLAFSPDGELLATGGNDKTVRLWEVRSGNERARLEGHQGDVVAVSFSPDSRTLASGGGGHLVLLWNLETKKQSGRLQGHEDTVTALAWSRDGKSILSSSQDKTLRLWNVETRTLVRSFSGHKGGVTRVAWSPDETLIASGGWDGTIRFWQTATGKEVRKLDSLDGEQRRREQPPFAKVDPGTEGQLGYIAGLAFTPDGKSLISTGQGSVGIHQWSVATGRMTRDIPALTNVLCLAVSPDGKTVASAESMLMLRDVATGKPSLDFDGHRGRPFGAVFTPDSKTIITCGEDGTLRFWDASQGKELRRIDAYQGFSLRVGISPDGTRLGSMSFGKLTIWDAATGQKLSQQDEPSSGSHGSPLCFSPDGSQMLSASGQAALWEAATGKEKWRVRSGVRAGAFSPTGEFVALVEDRALTLRNPATGEIVRQSATNLQEPFYLAITPDGRTVIATDYNRPVRLYEVATGKERMQIGKEGDYIYTLALSPTGRLVATTAGHDRPRREFIIQLWDLTTGQEVHRLAGHRGFIGSVTFSPDGKLLVSTSEDGTALVWDVARVQK
jgi:WD40 repeat protein